MSTTTIQKWGNSYAVRLPKNSLRKLNLSAGSSVEIREAVRGEMLSIIPVRHRAASLAEMAARITKENSHDAADWGRAKGKEIW